MRHECTPHQKRACRLLSKTQDLLWQCLATRRLYCITARVRVTSAGHAAASLTVIRGLPALQPQPSQSVCPWRGLQESPIYSTDSGGRRNRRKNKGALMPGRQGSKGLALVVGQLTETFKDGRFFLHSACLSLPAWALGDAGCKGTGDENKVAFSAARPAWFDKVISQLRDL